MAKSPEEAMQSMIENLKTKKGKSLDEWLKITKSKKDSKHGEIDSFLKANHGLGHGYANLVAHKTLASDSESIGSADKLIDGQNGGPKAALKPIYVAVIAAVKKLGPDIDVSPKKSYVSLRRKKQFALI